MTTVYVAYLNGIEISRSDNLIGNPPAFDDFTENDHEAQLYQGDLPDAISIDFESTPGLLTNGINVLAIQVHNVGLTSSDMSGNFYLSAGISVPNFNYFPVPNWFVGAGENIYFHTNFKLSP